MIKASTKVIVIFFPLSKTRSLNGNKEESVPRVGQQVNSAHYTKPRYGSLGLAGSVRIVKKTLARLILFSEQFRPVYQ
jgi:hypothetical protein